MIRSLFRLLGTLLLLAGLYLLARDLVAAWQSGALAALSFQPEALGQLWYALHPGSLNLLQAVTQRYLWAPLWDGAAVWLLLQPAFAVAGITGIVLLLLTRRRRRHHGMH
jgi:hypothetical protein